MTYNLVVSNSFFTKKGDLLTYQSGENQSQTDYILVKQKNIKLVHDVKVISNEECVTQHKLLVCDAKMVKSEDWCKKFVPKQHVWKVRQADLCDKLCETFTGEMNDTTDEQVDNIWSRLKQDTLCYRENLWVDKERHMKKTNVVVQ